jgi:hypothetical protein
MKDQEEDFRFFRFFDLQNNLPVLRPECRTIKEFRRLIERDKGSKGDHDGRDKRQAVKELAFIYFEETYGSPFKEEKDKETRLKQIKLSLDLPEDWKPDEEVLEAAKVYKKLQTTSSMNLLDSMEKAIYKLKAYLDNTDLNETVAAGSRKGELLNDPVKYKSIVKDFAELQEGLKKQKEIVHKEIEEKLANRRGRQGNRYNE